MRLRLTELLNTLEKLPAPTSSGEIRKVIVQESLYDRPFAESGTATTEVVERIIVVKAERFNDSHAGWLEWTIEAGEL